MTVVSRIRTIARRVDNAPAFGARGSVKAHVSALEVLEGRLWMGPPPRGGQRGRGPNIVNGATPVARRLSVVANEIEDMPENRQDPAVLIHIRSHVTALENLVGLI